MKALLSQNPTKLPRASSSEQARAVALCAAIAAALSDEIVAYAAITESTAALPAWVRVFIDKIDSAATIAGFPLAPTGSARKHAFDCGGRILNAVRREAAARWDINGKPTGANQFITHMEGCVYPYLFELQNAVKSVLKRLDEMGLLFSQRDEFGLIKDFRVGDFLTRMSQIADVDAILSALRFVELDFDIDRRHGQVYRIRRHPTFNALCEFVPALENVRGYTDRNDLACMLIEARSAWRKQAS